MQRVIPLRLRRLKVVLLVSLLIGGCATIVHTQIDYEALYGPEAPRDRILDRQQYQAALDGGAVSYPRDVKPILDSRCVVCHACYDAPCQLKLSAAEGLERGATKRLVYDGARLSPEQPTRLFVDAVTTEQWRGMEFYPVINERSESPQANLDNSLIARLLRLKRHHPLPGPGPLPKDFAFGLDRELECPRMEEFDGYEADHPLWGMPYGLPGLTPTQERTIVDWLRQGARRPPHPPLPRQTQERIGQWERFLNGQSLKERLVARYIYEHLFIGHLQFKGGPADQFFRLVRSRTPPGRPLSEIATVRPYDDPGPEPFYYRLRPVVTTIVDKNHFVYELGPEKMERLHELFFQPDWELTDLPSYRREVASNPFRVFAQLPGRARYKFLLDDAQFFVAGFIKGPVCRGQIALNVIRDRFWVAFLDPDLPFLEKESDFLAGNSDLLALPAADGDDPGLFDFARYNELAKRYMAVKEQEIDKLLPTGVGPSINFLWDGDGHNRNALLTVFRHFDSASVVKGLVGDTPLSAWVIDYPLFERIHYLLVAGFNVYGAAGHQLATRLYMDYLRMEAENDFLRFLPADRRASIRAQWYRGLIGRIKNIVSMPLYGANRPTGIDYHTDDPKSELFDRLRIHLGEAAGPKDVLNQCPLGGCTRAQASRLERRVESRLQALARLQGPQVRALPEVAFVRIETKNPADDLAYTLIRNKMLENVSIMVAERLRRDPDNDTVTLVPGFLGSYPNAFFGVSEEHLEQFIEMVANAQDDAATEALYATFGIRRSDPRFWTYSDWFNLQHKRKDPTHAGWFDMNRYENR